MIRGFFFLFFEHVYLLYLKRDIQFEIFVINDRDVMLY